MSDVIVTVKAHLKSSKSSLTVVRAEGSRLVVRCRLCAKETVQHHSYWLKYGCYCGRAERISKAKRLDQEALGTFLASVNIKRVGEYINMNTPTDVQCLLCKHRWLAYLGNIRQGHGCGRCAFEKCKQRTLKKYGVEYHTQRPEIQRKISKTMRKRFGVSHALQNKELFDKNLTTAYRTKEVRLGSRVVKVQGYEPEAIKWLLAHLDLKPSDIRCGVGDKKLPSIQYYYQGKRRVYHPDIYVPKWNKVYEVKSEYTFKTSVEVNQAKRRACKSLGYKFSFLVMDKHGNRVE